MTPFVIHVHLREKILSVNVGEGSQCIYWLGITAVQRYLRQPDSYSSPFSQELTPKHIISEEGERLDNNARVRDELKPDDHTWVDVGDGVPLSDVKSRRVLKTGGAFELPIEEVSERINWVKLEVADEDEEPDERPTMRYSRLKLPTPPAFSKWQSELSSTSEEHYQVGNRIPPHPQQRLHPTLTLTPLPPVILSGIQRDLEGGGAGEFARFHILDQGSAGTTVQVFRPTPLHFRAQDDRRGSFGALLCHNRTASQIRTQVGSKSVLGTRTIKLSCCRLPHSRVTPSS